MQFDRTQEGPRVMSRRAKLLAAGVAAAAAIALAACFAKRPATVEPTGDNAKSKEKLFRDWPKPDLIVMISGQQHGYLDPCGCSAPQIGGLVRRYNFLQTLKDRGWPVMSVDAGDIAQNKGPADLPNAEGLIKYKYSMEALALMGYSAVTFGAHETTPSLIEYLSAFTLNNIDSKGKPLPPFVLAANLDKKDEKFPALVESWKIVNVANAQLKVGIVGVVGPSAAKEIKDADVQFPEGSSAQAIRAALKAMDSEKLDLRILLYNGQPEEAQACAKTFPSKFQIIACVSRFDEPPSNAEIVKEAGTMIVTVGHKGKYVGAVGINRTGKEEPKFELRYQLVRLEEEYLTPKGKEQGHPVMELMERYTKQLKQDNYLAKFYPSKHPNQLDKGPSEMPVFVGSERCKKCHESAHEIWEKSGHAHAYEALLDPKKKNPPSNRQFDGECIVCHTVGFMYVSGFRNEKETPKLINVGCESCHGPASEHAKHPNNAQLRAELNPWKGNAKRIERELCIKCHDTENDVHWSFDKWKQVEHYNPKGE
jgi:hypothetical protein